MEESAYSSWLLERLATGDVVRLRMGKSTIGRSIAATIRTNPNTIYVSRNHAVLTVTADDRLFIQDLVININSSNGVYINDNLCRENIEELKAGFRIGMGIPVSDDSMTDLEHYVYLVKYLPIKQPERTKPDVAARRQFMEHTPPMVIDHVLPSQPLSPSPSPSPPQIAERSDSSLFKRRYPPLLDGAMITISDDDDDDEPMTDITKGKMNELEQPKTRDKEETKEIHEEKETNAIHEKKETNAIHEETETNAIHEEKDDIAKAQNLNLLHAPLVSGVKQEQIKNIANDVEDIFGGPDDIIMGQLKNDKPNLAAYVYNYATNKPQISAENRPLRSGDFVNLESDDDDDVIASAQIPAEPPDVEKCDENELVSKSPNIFEISISSKEDDSHEETKCVTSSKTADMEYCGSYEPRSDDEDVEDIMFSQMVVNDMKTDLDPDDFDNSPINTDNDAANFDMLENCDLLAYVKKEPIDSDNPCTSAQARTAAAINDSTKCWIVSDDEDYDEELENKVSGWENKLFSQNVSNFGMSQIFELSDIKQDIDDMLMQVAEDEGFTNNMNSTNAIDDYDDNDYFDRKPADTEQILEEMRATIKDAYNCVTPDGIEDDKSNEADSSPIVRCRRKTRTVIMSSSESESEDDIIKEKESKLQDTVKPCKIVLARMESSRSATEENKSTISPNSDNEQQVEPTKQLQTMTNVSNREVRKSISEMPKDDIISRDRKKSISDMPKDDTISRERKKSTSEMPKDDIISKERMKSITDLPKDDIITRDRKKSISDMPKDDTISRERKKSTSEMPKDDIITRDRKKSISDMPKDDTISKERKKSISDIPQEDAKKITEEKTKAHRTKEEKTDTCNEKKKPERKKSTSGHREHKEPDTNRDKLKATSTNTKSNEDRKAEDQVKSNDNDREKEKHSPHKSTKEKINVLERRKSVSEPSTSKTTTAQMPMPTSTKTKQCPPLIIDAPQLPRHKGKLRGVSAATAPSTTHASDIAKKVQSICDNVRQEIARNDLKRKWVEKPNVEKAREKERRKIIKIDRKERLHQLAEKNRQDEKEVPLKRKSTNENPDSGKFKIPNVKITTVNRGAFLTEQTSTAAKCNAAGKKIVGDAKRVRNVDIQTFEEAMSKLDNIEIKQQQKSTSNSYKATTTTIPKPICKEAITARAQRTTNKITFASMQKNMDESLENQKKLKTLTITRSCLTDVTMREPKNVKQQKKTVRFAEKPMILEIERVRTGPLRRVNAKDVARKPTIFLQERRQRVRRAYPLRDHSDDIITRTLLWSNEWLITRNADASAAADCNAIPMPTHFNSYEQYKSILLPLLKMEYINTLQRDFTDSAKATTYKATLEYANVNKNRLVLIAKVYCPKVGPWNGLKYELVLLDFFKFKIQNSFAYISNMRQTGNYHTMILEIPADNYNRDELLSSVKELHIRPVVENLRMAHGPYNAIEQLESMPLFNTILNPAELLKQRQLQHDQIKYMGYDATNEQQRNIILSTYQKIIDISTPNITLIQGPPGTGKSRTITNLALQTLYGTQAPMLDYRILICAQSNYAVDVVAKKFAHIKTQPSREKLRFNVIRFGMLDKMDPEVANTISLQKHVEHEQIRKLQTSMPNITCENKENLNQQMIELKSKIAELRAQKNIKNTVQEHELIEKEKQLSIMQNIAYGNMRPEDKHDMYAHYLKSAHIVCTTVSSCIKLQKYVDYFDVCIIDEATQCTEPWTLVPLRFGINSLVLVGDTMQLPATVFSKKASDLGLRNSFFTRVQQCLESQKNRNTNGVFNTLIQQYRMHPDICRWPNAYFYKNQLQNGSITLKYKSDIVPFSILNLAYSQNDNCDNGQYVNDLEAKFVVKLIKALESYLPAQENSYGVITPYALHRDTLSKAIKSAVKTSIMVNTIDSYQGLEKDVIIISNARTRGIGFLSNYQRLNVALTRPRKCLILCGNFANLESVPAWRSLLTDARNRGLYHDISVDCVQDMEVNIIAKLKVSH